MLDTQFVQSDKPSINTKFKGLRPRGIILTDTYNTPFFPVEYPRIDTNKFTLPKIKQQIQTQYSGMKIDYLPWHFHIELLENAKYFVFDTRPIDMKFPLNNIDAIRVIKDNNINLINNKTKEFFENQPFDIEDSIHISIVGDTNLDIYTYNIYKLIGRVCIGPILRLFKLHPKLYQSIYPINIGDKFDPNLLEQFMVR